MAQYMYDKDGNRTVILSEEEEQKNKMKAWLVGGCYLQQY